MSELADEFRRKAAGCRQVADLSPEPDRRAHWIKQAEQWERRLATEEAKKSAP
jgi:hypothetical protein